MPAVRIVLAEARPVRRHRLHLAIRTLAGIHLTAATGTLMEAYSVTEAEMPDAVLVCGVMRALPEFAMFSAMTRLLGIAELDLTEDDDGRPASPILAALRRLADTGPTRRPVPGPPPARALPKVAARPQVPDRLGVILIGASTGGVEALHRILADFPADCPPTLVVQHIRGAFSAAFAERLNRACRAEVAEASPDRLLAPGLILIAPGDSTHLELRGPSPLRCRLTEAPPLTGHRPSVDALFRSATPLGCRAVGVLLTGMGQDGARGLKQIREAGGHTIAQDRDSSIVYGMPRIAADLGAAVEVLALDRIGRAVLAAARYVPAAAGIAAVRP